MCIKRLFFSRHDLEIGTGHGRFVLQRAWKVGCFKSLSSSFLRYLSYTIIMQKHFFRKNFPNSPVAQLGCKTEPNNIDFFLSPFINDFILLTKSWQTLSLTLKSGISSWLQIFFYLLSGCLLNWHWSTPFRVVWTKQNINKMKEI